jgi:hypothetical protein
LAGVQAVVALARRARSGAAFDQIRFIRSFEESPMLRLMSYNIEWFDDHFEPDN